MFNKAVKNINELVSDQSLIHLLSAKQKDIFCLSNPKLVVGQIVSDNRFLANNEDKENLLLILPEVLCAEMEGAAVAQVCLNTIFLMLSYGLFRMRQMIIQ